MPPAGAGPGLDLGPWSHALTLSCDRACLGGCDLCACSTSPTSFNTELEPGNWIARLSMNKAEYQGVLVGSYAWFGSSSSAKPPCPVQSSSHCDHCKAPSSAVIVRFSGTKSPAIHYGVPRAAGCTWCFSASTEQRPGATHAGSSHRSLPKGSGQ